MDKIFCLQDFKFRAVLRSLCGDGGGLDSGPGGGRGRDHGTGDNIQIALRTV